MICLGISLLIPCSFAQKPAEFGIKSKKALKYYLEGKQFAQWRDRARAVEAFQAAVIIEPDFAHAHYELGINQYVQKNFVKALPHFQKAYASNPTEFSGYYYAEVLFFNEQYEAAISQYETFIALGRGRDREMALAKLNLKKARFAIQAIQEPVEFEPQNMGTLINSEQDDYLPYLTADDQYLLFTSRRPGGIGGYDPQLRGYSEDFYFSEYSPSTQTWSPAKNLGPPINTERNEGAPAISQDGRIIIFTTCDHPEGIGSCDLFYAVREGDRWSEPQNLGPQVNSESWDSQPCLSHDGKTLYFASNRPGGKGGRDIWYSTRIGKKWTAARNLEGPVNTIGHEAAPFLHADGVSLYFSSTFHPGFGRNDLFISRFQEKQWSTPQNLGYPLNTAAEESNIFVNPSGKQGYINSNREGGLGKSDIYEFTLDQRIRPRVATFLRGISRDSLTQEPVYARIRLVDVESGDTLREAYSDRTNGRFLMSVPMEREYAAFVEAKGYLFASKHFYLKDPEEEIYFDVTIDLLPIREGATVTLNNIFFETGKYELQSNSFSELQFLTTYLKQNSRISIEIEGHTDDVGLAGDNLKLSQQRADAVRAYLIQEGIEADRISSKGYGESRPIVPNTSEENRAQNRRTEFRIVDVE